MYICTEHDEEIRKCPFCNKEVDMQKEIDKLEKIIETLEETISNLNDEQ